MVVIVHGTGSLTAGGANGTSHPLFNSRTLAKGRSSGGFFAASGKYHYNFFTRKLKMALTSPGVEVTVIDESQYIPSAVNTVPYFLIATAQNKVSGDGVTVAAGTTAANANKTYLITSQRDLVATFGVPFFYNTTTGTPINGYELNEYGLLAAYSALGVTNRCYVQRANINLTELTASLVRPTGNANNGTYWLDTSTTQWGIQEWNQSTAQFTVKTPLVITETEYVVDAAGGDYTPVTSYGSIGDYAITALSVPMYGYYKNADNVWVLVGSDDWKMSWPTVAGTATPSSLTNGANMYINGTLCTVGAGSTALTVAGFATAINNAAITGVSAMVKSGRLQLFCDSTATNDGSSGDGGLITIEKGPNLGAALLAALGITANTYLAPTYLPSYSYQAPRWRTTDTTPHPTGSVWNNLSTVNYGMDIRIKKWSATLGEWVAQKTPAYNGLSQAIYGLDPVNGGRTIPVGTTYINPTANYYETIPLNTMCFEILEQYAFGQTIVTGTSTPTGNAFTPGNTFAMAGSQPGTTSSITSTVTIGGTGSVADFIAAVSAAAVPYVSASVNSAGNIVFTHSAGGWISLTPGTGNPITTAGFTLATPKVRQSFSVANRLILTNMVSTPLFTYTAMDTAPDQDPANGTMWYYSTATQVDIMIQDNGHWMGYQNVNNDVRGFDLALTNASGPICSATAPMTQNDDAESPLVYGDLWLDTSDLENYPKLYRWQLVSGQAQWVAIDTTDQVTQNGILFADARWAPNGTTDPVSGAIPSIVSLLTSNYLDLDAPDPALYPQGMLLFNTRRSGYNVKSFQKDYFNATSYPADPWSSITSYSIGSYVSYNDFNYISMANANVNHTPGTNANYWQIVTMTNTWLSESGNRENGAMWGGRLAQRQVIVKALKSGIDTSEAAREEQNQFNIIACPSYPELEPNMIALSNERNNTLFVVGDTPMRLGPDGNSLVEWATNNNGLGLPAEDGLVATSNYMATFYPSCLTNDLSGNTVVAPPSHMMVRTILRSDAVSYPWLAPAGTRRGVVDNATAIGYINSATGEFVQISCSQAVRDILYEHNVNPITFIPGVGIVNFGNKTSLSVTTALDRINVARLICYLRGRLEEIGKLYLFEPNDQITRNEITNTVNSLMIDLIAKRAIYDYLVVCDLSNNTPARIDRSELWVDIAIEPVKAVEFIYIPLRIKNTGEISGAAGR